MNFPFSIPLRIVVTLTAGLAILIAVFTLSPPPEEPGPAGIDKLFHALAFAILVRPLSLHSPRALVWLIPAAAIFGGAIELIQPSVGRGREFMDFVADLAGVGLGAFIGLFFRRKLLRTD